MVVTPFPQQTDASIKSRNRLADIDARLASLVPEESAWPAQLHSAQRHALLAPGKRIRPLLCLLIVEGCGGDVNDGLDVACVSEMVHAASLILDDLPCMDDAELRRSQPTVHVAFSESTAILTATALLNRAFGVLMRAPRLSAETRVELGDMLSYAVGSKGLIAGQIADLANDDLTVSDAEVERLNTLKTGALFDFAVDGGALVAAASPQQRRDLRDFSQQLGLAFQLLDDIKDVVMSDYDAGKSTSRDADKSTLVHIEGVKSSLSRLRGYRAELHTALTRADISTADEIQSLLDTYFDPPRKH